MIFYLYEGYICVLMAAHGKSWQAPYDLQVLHGLAFDHFFDVISYFFPLLLVLAAWNVF